MYRGRCSFCGQELNFEFFDDLEAHIMACRDALRAAQETSLQGYEPILHWCGDTIVAFTCLVQERL